MKPRITVLTLGVDDLGRRGVVLPNGLGLRTEGIVGTEFEHGAVAFFDLQPGLRLALWPRRSISHHPGVPSSPRSGTELTIGRNVNSREAVDDVVGICFGGSYVLPLAGGRPAGPGGGDRGCPPAR